MTTERWEIKGEIIDWRDKAKKKKKRLNKGKNELVFFLVRLFIYLRCGWTFWAAWDHTWDHKRSRKPEKSVENEYINAMAHKLKGILSLF